MAKTTSDRDASATMSCLLSALKEAQDSIRSYDTKAQIVGVGFIFTLNVITAFGANLPVQNVINAIAVTMFWILAIGPIILFGFVLYPSRKTVLGLLSHDAEIKHIYYVSKESTRNLDDYLKDIGSGNWHAEIAYEIIKVSSLRDTKRMRFIRALRASAFSLLVIAFFQVLRSSGLALFAQ
jgi:hypothetical protein